MIKRTFGWIQDPGKISNLRKVVEAFDIQSKTHVELKLKKIPELILEEDVRSRLVSELNKIPLELNYRDLVGTSFKPRDSARCNGIIQALIKGQKRPYISDWPADNFIRWAQALGFIKWEKTKDSFAITEKGLTLSKTEIDSDEEYYIYEYAFLSYPPVCRILKLLVDESQKGNGALTKFEIGSQLGFKGEEGFTSISQSFYVKELSVSSKSDRKKIRSNWEGDSDKYARMICNWLTKLKYPWIEKVRKKVSIEYGEEIFSETLPAFKITKKGFEVRKKMYGTSKFKKVSKIVNFGMLSTKGSDRQYLRTRRAFIINSITGKKVSLTEIQKKLKEKGLDENEKTVKSDIEGLENIGLSIGFSRQKYYCNDDIIGLEIPQLKVEETQISDIQQMITKCRDKLTIIPSDYLVLISMGFDKSKNKLFEIKTIELLSEHCRFHGLHLGGQNRPDGIIYNKDCGVIIDTKSYKSGFSITAAERDKMKRYIDENKIRKASRGTSNFSRKSSKSWLEKLSCN